MNKLSDCIRCLGWSVGFRYWRMGVRARKNPSLVIQWAFACRRMSIREPHNDFWQRWAEELEKSYANYMNPTTEHPSI